MGYGCFRRYFVDHPESVNENYLTHGVKATWFGCRMVVFGLCEFIHAAIPGIDLFELCNTSSHIELEKICNELKERKTM
jgi:hypothetical protein